MKAAPFEYSAAHSVQDAVARLADTADRGGRILAGGQSLVPMMALRVAYPTHLIDINRIPELQGAVEDAGRLRVRAITRHNWFALGQAPGRLGLLLADVAHHIAHHPIRERGTFCGSVAHSDPASEWCLVTATLGGRIQALSADGERHIDASDYFTGIMSTDLSARELLASVSLPLLSDTCRFGFGEFNRRAGDFAIAMSLATFELREGRMSDVRLGVGGVEAFPRRLTRVEQLLEGTEPTSGRIDEAACLAAEQVDPLEDLQIDAAYRRDLTRAMVRRALTRALRGIHSSVQV